jgi:hypothetical protein
MTQDQLNQIFEDVFIHGRHVEGWSFENRDGGHFLTDVKRGDSWGRSSPDEEWRASTQGV